MQEHALQAGLLQIPVSEKSPYLSSPPAEAQVARMHADLVGATGLNSTSSRLKFSQRASSLTMLCASLPSSETLTRRSPSAVRYLTSGSRTCWQAFFQRPLTSAR